MIILPKTHFKSLQVGSLFIFLAEMIIPPKNSIIKRQQVMLHIV